MVDSQLPKPGDVIGVRYRIESMLGQGGMGAVFAAVNQATGRAVAIKWMLPGAARSQESLARFLSEARATAKIEHPNVIQILDVGQDGDCPFLVMERLRGRSLADRLEKAGRMSPEETLSVLIPACRGVHEAHTEGIIHRDLKPDNIFLCEGKDGSPRAPKVLDFGISKLFDQEGGASLTQTGIAMGTPQYMSPEQLNAPPDADARFDVYAMGVVLYECLTGRPPYNAEGLFELVQQIASGNPEPIRALAPDTPPDLDAAVMRAMHINRDMRHRTMEELIAELEHVSQRMQSGAPAPSAPLASLPRTVSMTSAPGVGTGPMSTAASSPSGPQHTPTAAPVSAASGGTKGAGIIGLVAGVVVLLGLLVVGAGLFFALRDDDDSSSAPPVAQQGGGSGPEPVTDTVGSSGNAGLLQPNIGLTFTGACQPRFDAQLLVLGAGGSVTVISRNLGGPTGSIGLSLPGIHGMANLSTQHQTDTQTQIIVTSGVGLEQHWANSPADLAAVRRGRAPDPISGSIRVAQFDPALARVDVTFHDVTLQNARTGSICTVNGRLETFGTIRPTM